MLQGDTLDYKVNNKKKVLMSHFLGYFPYFLVVFFSSTAPKSHIGPNRSFLKRRL